MTQVLAEHNASLAHRANRKRLVKKLLRLAVAIAVLTLLFRKVPLGEVATALAHANGLYVLAAIALALATQWMTALRLAQYTTAQGLALSTAQLFQINLAAMFYGLFLPGGNVTGLAIRFYKLSGEKRLSAGAAVSILNDRITATVTLCIIGILFWFLERPAGGRAVLFVMLAILAGLLSLLGLLVTQRKIPILWQLKQALSILAGRKLHALRDAVRQSRRLSLRRLILAFALSFVGHLFGIIGYSILAHALGLNVPFITVGWIRSGMILATMIPISISGLGLREGAALLLLEPYGISGQHAVALALLAFAVTVLTPGLLGGALEAARSYPPTRRSSRP
jgi:hypothetical protein